MEHNRSKGIQDSQNKSEEVSRRRFLRRGSLATGLTVLASAFSLVPFSPAHAAATTSPDIPQVTKMGGHEANLYLQQVLESQDYQRFRRQVQQNYTGVLSLQEQASSVLRIADKQNTLIAVRIPISGGTNHSFYMATFLLESYSILQTFSALFTVTSERNIAIIAERSGQVLMDATITPQGKFVYGTANSESGTIIELKGLSTQQMRAHVTSSSVHPDSGPSFEFCCAINGLILFGIIDIAVAAALILICAGPCVVTLGGGCLVCLTAAGVIGGAEVGFVLAECHKDPSAFLHAFFC